MQHWNELHTVYAVARHGTVLAASRALGVHRATVVRHVDALEAELGAPLFHRHRQGYTLTEAGKDLLEVARAADESFREMAGRLRGRGGALSGHVTVTSIPLLSSLMMQAIASYRLAHPGVVVAYRVDHRVLRLDHGEAHVSLRMGARPDHPDEVVQTLPPLRSGLYASHGYLDAHPDTVLEDHDFVSQRHLESATGWLAAAVPAARVVLECTDARSALDGLRAGLGVGFCPAVLARAHGLVPILGREDWDVPTWLVTHVGVHRTAKVRELAARVREVVTDALADPEG